MAEIVAQSFPVNKVFGINSQNLQEKICDGVLFSDTTFIKKGLNTNKLMLIENNNLISEESVLANTMNQYFTNITKQLNIKKSPQLKNLEDIINYYHNHISIVKIKSSNNTHSDLFTSNLVLSDEIKRKILTLNNKEASREGDIPVNILKDDTDTYLPILTKVFKSSNEQNGFPNELKLAHVFPIYKKKILLMKKIIGPRAYCHTCLRFLRDLCIKKLKHE